MNNYLELAQLSDGTIVLRRSDDKENPLVKIKFSGESKQLLQGQELHIAKEMIRAGIESISGNVSDFDEFFESQLDNIKKKEVTLHNFLELNLRFFLPVSYTHLTLPTKRIV